MPIRIIDAEIEKDIDVFTDLLNRNRKKKVSRARFEWLYLKNPAGLARAWFVVDEKTGQEVAFTCVLPRRIRVNGEDILVWNCGDFSVDKKFRTLGVAMKLRRKAKDSVDEGHIPAFYAHPNDRMKTVHEAVGHHCIGKMKRYVKLLRADTFLRQRLANENLRQMVQPFGNAALWLNDLLIRNNDRGYDGFPVEDQPFSQEYDHFYNRVAEKYSVIGDRSSAYLNWRYYENPLYQTERYELRKKGVLTGYILYTISENMVLFKDMLCLRQAEPEHCLVEKWIAYLREKKVHSISAIFMDTHPLIPVFVSKGFKLRPDHSSVFAYAKKGTPLSDTWLNGANWYMTVGDRDV